MIWVISSRSLRSAQARKRVPSLASPSLGHYATLSLVVIGRGEIISDFGFGIADFGFIKEIRNQETGGRHEAESIGKRVGGWRSASLEVGGKSRTTRGDGETETRRER